MKRVIGWIIGSLLVVVLLTLGGGYYLTRVALQPTVERSEEHFIASFDEHYPDLVPWFTALRAEGAIGEITRKGADGCELQAYYIPAESASTRTAILVHGYTDHPFGMMQYGWIYREKLGCNLLLPTLRYHGKSGGDHIQMGWNDRLDIKQWIEVCDTLFGEGQEIVIHGLSMGAATVMMLSGETDLPTSVRCMVEDCGYTSVWDQFSKELKEDYHLPTFPILQVARKIAQWRFGWDFCEASALEAVGRSTCPMLFIHGGNDHYVPTCMVYPLYEAKTQRPKQQWIAPDAGHADAYMDHPESYAEVVCTFCEQYFD